MNREHIYHDVLNLVRADDLDTLRRVFTEYEQDEPDDALLFWNFAMYASNFQVGFSEGVRSVIVRFFRHKDAFLK